MAKKRAQQLRFQLPYTVEPPVLVSQSVGTQRLLQRPARSQLIEATVLDSPDNRLLRSGVVLAYRVLADLGQWYLAAPSWQPWLPEEASFELAADGELPAELANWIKPISRGANLGPVAALSCEKTEYDLVGVEDAPLASISDLKVTVRRAGVITARYREATIRPTEQLSPQQREFIVQAMASVAADSVDAFPSLQQRLGPPATGLTDFPEPQPLRPRASLEEFVTAILAVELRGLTQELLALVTNEGSELAGLNTRLADTLRTISGLSQILEPRWCQELAVQLAELPFLDRSEALSSGLQVSEALTNQIRAPRVGEASRKDAAPKLVRRIEQLSFTLADRCRVLDQAAAAQQWRSAYEVAEQLAAVTAVSSRLPGLRLRKLTRLIQQLAQQLGQSVDDSPAMPTLDGLTPNQIFELGAASQQRQAALWQERSGFVAAWPAQIRALNKLLAKLRKRV